MPKKFTIAFDRPGMLGPGQHSPTLEVLTLEFHDNSKNSNALGHLHWIRLFRVSGSETGMLAEPLDEFFRELPSQFIRDLPPSNGGRFIERQYILTPAMPGRPLSAVIDKQPQDVVYCLTKLLHTLLVAPAIGEPAERMLLRPYYLQKYRDNSTPQTRPEYPRIENTGYLAIVDFFQAIISTPKVVNRTTYKWLAELLNRLLEVMAVPELPSTFATSPGLRPWANATDRAVPEAERALLATLVDNMSTLIPSFFNLRDAQSQSFMADYAGVPLLLKKWQQLVPATRRRDNLDQTQDSRSGCDFDSGSNPTSAVPSTFPSPLRPNRPGSPPPGSPLSLGPPVEASTAPSTPARPAPSAAAATTLPFDPSKEWVKVIGWLFYLLNPRSSLYVGNLVSSTASQLRDYTQSEITLIPEIRPDFQSVLAVQALLAVYLNSPGEELGEKTYKQADIVLRSYAMYQYSRIIEWMQANNVDLEIIQCYRSIFGLYKGFGSGSAYRLPATPGEIWRSLDSSLQASFKQFFINISFTPGFVALAGELRGKYSELRYLREKFVKSENKQLTVWAATPEDEPESCDDSRYQPSLQYLALAAQYRVFEASRASATTAPAVQLPPPVPTRPRPNVLAELRLSYQDPSLDMVGKNVDGNTTTGSLVSTWQLQRYGGGTFLTVILSSFDQYKWCYLFPELSLTNNPAISFNIRGTSLDIMFKAANYQQNIPLLWMLLFRLTAALCGQYKANNFSVIADPQDNVDYSNLDKPLHCRLALQQLCAYFDSLLTYTASIGVMLGSSQEEVVRVIALIHKLLTDYAALVPQADNAYNVFQDNFSIFHDNYNNNIFITTKEAVQSAALADIFPKLRKEEVQQQQGHSMFVFEDTVLTLKHYRNKYNLPAKNVKQSDYAVNCWMLRWFLAQLMADPTKTFQDHLRAWDGKVIVVGENQTKSFDEIVIAAGSTLKSWHARVKQKGTSTLQAEQGNWAAKYQPQALLPVTPQLPGSLQLRTPPESPLGMVLQMLPANDYKFLRFDGYSCKMCRDIGYTEVGLGTTATRDWCMCERGFRAFLISAINPAGPRSRSPLPTGSIPHNPLYASIGDVNANANGLPFSPIYGSTAPQLGGVGSGVIGNPAYVVPTSTSNSSSSTTAGSGYYAACPASPPSLASSSAAAPPTPDDGDLYAVPSGPPGSGLYAQPSGASAQASPPSTQYTPMASEPGWAVVVSDLIGLLYTITSKRFWFAPEHLIAVQTLLVDCLVPSGLVVTLRDLNNRRFSDADNAGLPRNAPGIQVLYNNIIQTLTNNSYDPDFIARLKGIFGLVATEAESSEITQLRQALLPSDKAGVETILGEVSWKSLRTLSKDIGQSWREKLFNAYPSLRSH